MPGVAESREQSLLSLLFHPPREMRERPRPETPPPRTCCFCIQWRGKKTALGVAVLLAAAGTVGCWGVSAYRRGDATIGLGLRVKGRAGNGKRSGVLPQCYSSPEANPSEGEWRSCTNGVKDSPADMIDWDFPVAQFGFLGRYFSFSLFRRRQ